MNYYDEIKNKLIDDEIYAKVKDYSKERHRVLTYYEIGKILSDAGKHYGENIIGEYSKRLMLEVNKKYNSRTLRRMRQLYHFFEEQKWSPLGTKLSISHIRILFGLDDSNKIKYYVDQTIERNLTKRQLEEIIKNKEYERLPESARNRLILKEENKLTDLIKEPILIRNKNNVDVITEKTLHSLILEDISAFLKELGNCFTFVDSEYKIKIGERYNYIDFLLSNYEYNCFVVVELKATELKKEHIGQIEIYMNYIDEHVKKINHYKTIGIIICKENNKYIMKYCSDKRILSKEYVLM